MRVPLDERLLLVLVCTAWRRALEEPLLWATADVSCVRLDFKDTFLRAVAAKSRGALTSLDVYNSVCEFIYGDHPVTMTRDALWEVLRASPQLRHLRVYSPSDEGVRFDNITALVSAAPSLRVLEADIECSDDEACLVLRVEPPFGVLRLRRLCVNGMNPEDAAVLTFTSALEGSAAPPSELHVIVLPDTHVGLDALVNALVMTRMSSLIVGSVQQPPAFDATPYFVRLLKEGHLTALNVSGSLGHSNDYPPDWIDSLTLSFAFCEALRGSKLTSLALCGFDALWDDLLGIHDFFDGIIGHAYLQRLSINWCTADGFAQNRRVLGDALGRLVAANAPTFAELRVYNCGPKGLRPIIAALPVNTHLRLFDCSYFEYYAARCQYDHGRAAQQFTDDLMRAVQNKIGFRLLYGDRDDKETFASTWEDAYGEVMQFR